MGEPTPPEDETPAGESAAPVSPGGSAAPVPDASPYYREDETEPLSSGTAPAGTAGETAPLNSADPAHDAYPGAETSRLGLGDVAYPGPAETAPLSPQHGAYPGAETARFNPEDGAYPAAEETARLTPEDLARPGAEPGGTVIMPTDSPAWSGRAGVPVPPGSLREPVPYPTGEPQQSRTWWTPILLGLLALGLVGIVLLAAFLINKQPSSPPQPTPTMTPAPQPSHTVAPETTAAAPTASPSAALVQVPGDLVGKSQDDATAALDAIGLNYSFEFQASDQPKGTVIKTSPESGKLVPVGSVVKLLISLGGQTPTPTATASP